ncbi:uncharacterized protein PF3D7_1120600-like [Linepithema humile]|uniref:uncharacterized protein PF3D7_1120600-like n=1 Tax=Linepithema humile TaxID=83485 RepID=UPI000623212D|nr:PREDICTED: protein PFC0760c-like [Linepithema humile]
MPKVTKFKDLSPRQQNQCLLLAKQNSDEHNYNTKCMPKEQNLNIIETCRIKVEPTYTPDTEKAENVECIEEFYITYNNTKKQDTLQHRLHNWATDCNVTQKSLMALLNILREESHSELSSDTNNIKLEKHLPESIDVASSSTYIPAFNKLSNHIEKQNENINNVIWLPSTSKEVEFDDINNVNDVHDVLDINDVNVNNISDVNNINDVNGVNNVNDINNVNDVSNVNETQRDKCHTCCEACRTTQKTIMKKLDYIIHLLDKDAEYATNNECKPQLLPTLPLATVEDFFKFEEELQQNKEVRKHFKHKIAKVGGKMYKNKTRNIMKYFIHDNVSKQMSWTGQKDSMAIRNTVFASIIIDYITSTEECSLYQVQKVIQEWLRHAGDRLNYLLRK